MNRDVVLVVGMLCFACGGAPASASSSAGEEVVFADEAAQSPVVAEAESLLARGQAQSAKTNLQTYLAGDGANDARGWLNLGLACEMLDDIACARGAYERAIGIRESFYMARNNLGVLEREAGNLPRAQELLARVVHEHGDFASGQINLAMTLEDAGDVAGARIHYQATTRLVPNDASAWVGLGLLELAANNRSEALTALREAQSRVQSRADRYAVGRALRQAGDASLAVRVLESAVTESEEAPPVSLRAELALARYAAGQAQLAETDMRGLLRDEPANETFHRILGDMLAARSAFSDAVQQYQHAGDSPETRQRLARCREAMR